MTKRVYRYPVPFDDIVDIKMPIGARLLTIQVQHGEPKLWALVDPDRPVVTRRFRIADTGHPVEDWEATAYVGSFQLYSGNFVRHVFDLGEL